ncbi:Lrp/AsnC family transcriptional regulator [Halopiger xanaduensis]|uniref:Putative transcriptional regulator, AsnC family n=1 Tax=Halopiger xanaduensis (strain DSM 18323 / JCM 14033 / SH-6) TaxID=797210 RepID=F8DAB7_HALXS|nr:Lrp/AsnC family transcriptional regulator [Halopiger xanaduensis]AEH38200.1 putative transcriptional regulator, AsnC family [Halopiger xanaduensis SH-6]
MGFELDDIDRGILHRLQDDARHTTAADIAGEVGVTANTVRNRIRRLEEAGVIAGYVPLIDYERTEKSMHMVVQCTVPIHERGEAAATALEIDGVVGVRELMTGDRNLRIDLVAADTDEITAIVSRLQRAGIDVGEEELLKAEYRQPFDHFGADTVEE